MKRSFVLIALCALAIVGITVAAISKQQNANGNNHGKDVKSQSTTEQDLTGETAVSMDIKDYLYTKPNIKIKKGTTVTWTNQDVMEHNVMEAHEGDEAAHTAPRPDEVDPDHFVGPMLKKGQSYSFTFDETGSFPYHCAPHPYMTGTVTVVE